MRILLLNTTCNAIAMCRDGLLQLSCFIGHVIWDDTGFVLLLRPETNTWQYIWTQDVAKHASLHIWQCPPAWFSLLIKENIFAGAAVRNADVAWWRHEMETFSALLVICAGNSPVPREFPTQRPVTRSFDVFFDLRLNKPLKQPWGWWFEALSRPLWRHCNGKLFLESAGWHTGFGLYQIGSSLVVSVTWRSAGVRISNVKSSM